MFSENLFIFLKKSDNSYELWVCRDKNTVFCIQSGPNKVDKEKRFTVIGVTSKSFCVDHDTFCELTRCT